MKCSNINLYILNVLVIAISTANSETNITDALATKTPILEETINRQIGTKAELCKEKPCIRKCCHIKSVAFMMDQFDNSGSCKSKKALNLTLDLPSTPIYKSGLEVTGKPLNSTFQILRGYPVIRDGWLVNRDFFIIEDGKLVVERPNYYERYVEYEVDQFCLDHVKLFGSDQVVLRPFILPHTNVYDEPDHKVSLIAMLISSVFLIATLAVYSYVPRLYRKLHGKVLIAYSACLLGFFLTQSIYQLVYEVHGSIGILCHMLGVPSYFAIIASFFWMNIMSFDIWLQLRTMTYSNTLNKDEKKRFIKYCAYGFGVPLAMTIVFALFNYLPMDKINSAIVTPGITNKGCFLGGMERLFYVYIPMAVLIATNFVLFIASSVIICRMDIEAHNRKYKFLIYGKVFIIMGISWVLEIVSILESNHLAWKFVDAYNGLMGFFIFLIFVCNRRVFKMIAKRYRGRSLTTRTTKSNSSDSDSSDEVLN